MKKVKLGDKLPMGLSKSYSGSLNLLIPLWWRTESRYDIMCDQMRLAKWTRIFCMKVSREPGALKIEFHYGSHVL